MTSQKNKGFIFLFLMIAMLSGCSDTGEIIDNLKNQNSSLRVSVAKLTNELHAMKDKVSGEENILLIRSEAALNAEKQKNEKTKKELKYEYKSEFSESLSSELRSNIVWSTFWLTFCLGLFLLVVSVLIIRIYKAKAKGQVKEAEQKYEAKIKELSSKHDSYAHELARATSKKKANENEINAKSRLGKTLNKVLLDFPEINKESL